MGLGYLDNSTGEIHLLVAFRFGLSDEQIVQWQDIFNTVAQRFHRATRQKLKIGKISYASQGLVANGNGLHAADLIVHSSLDDRGYAYLNRFSVRGGNANVDSTIESIENTIVHELVHYIFNVSDEYRTPWFRLEIDRDVDLDTLIQEAEFPNGPSEPDDLKGRIVPLVAGQDLPADYTNFRVRIGNDLQRRIMFIIRDGYATTNAPFTKINENGEIVNAIPQLDAQSPIYGYETARCSSQSIMQDSSYDGQDSSGFLLCDGDNHEAGDPINAQHALHGLSCWETLVETMQETHGFDVEAAPTQAYSDPVVEQLRDEQRIAVVFDRSGSMGSGGKMQNAQIAAERWLSTYIPGDFFSLTWYNEDHNTTQALTELTSGSATDFSNQLDVQPNGYTNIQGALLEGLNQVTNGAPGNAAVKAVILMTDGQHNRPVGSDARSVIDQFKSAHTPIYAIGFGQQDEVDMNLLDDLAAGTGGVSYSWDDPEGMADAITQIAFELKTGIVLNWRGELGASEPTSTSRPKLSKKGFKPGLIKLLADTRLVDFRINPRGKPKKSNAASIPVLIEEGSVRAFFYFRKHSLKDPSWYYLLDPNDNEIDLNAQGKAYFNKHGIEQVVIEKPTPGIWHMMIVKDDSDKSKNTYSAIAASENPDLTLISDANKQNPKGAPVRIWANVSWVEPLSDVSVVAEITAPDGKTSSITLRDPEDDLRKKGMYEGYYLPTTSGRFTGKVKVSNRGSATKALAGTHPEHDEHEKKHEHSINIKSNAPRFVRYANFYFDSGQRMEVIDND